MTGKSAKVAERVAGRGYDGWDSRYVGWFDCFNAGEYYEAHDVLEDLWLEQGKAGGNYAFYKGLIQLAGAFVHLTKNRLPPSIALFRLAEANFHRYPDRHEGIDLQEVLRLAAGWREAVRVEAGINPLGSMPAPQVGLPGRVRPASDPTPS